MNLTLGDTEVLISESKKAGLLRNQLAYLLATAYWETGRTMKPIKEMGGEKYLRSKKYYPYFGRGYVQLTWDYNYDKAGKKIGVDLMGANKDKALDPVIAAKIIVQGMIHGWFTGKKLSTYITLSKSDFVNARRIINGTDKKHEIAKIAEQYDELLKDSGYGTKILTEAPEKPLQRQPDDPGVQVPETTKPFVEPATAFISTILQILIKLFGAKR